MAVTRTWVTCRRYTRQRIQDAKTVIQQVHDDLRNAEKAGLTTTKPETTFEEMLNAIKDSLSDLASSDNEEAGDDEDDDKGDAVGGKLCEDDEPGWVMGTISKTVRYCMERFRRKQIKLDEITQAGSGDASDYFCQRDMENGTTKWKVPAVIEPQMEVMAAARSLPPSKNECQRFLVFHHGHPKRCASELTHKQCIRRVYGQKY